MYNKTALYQVFLVLDFGDMPFAMRMAEHADVTAVTELYEKFSKQYGKISNLTESFAMDKLEEFV